MAVGSVYTAKDLAITYQPLLLVVFTFKDSAASPTVLRVSSHSNNVTDGYPPSGITGFAHNGQSFLARVRNQDLALTQALSEQGIDVTPSVTIDLSDADKTMWGSYERPLGFKGAKMELFLVFWNVGINDYSTDFKTIFTGTCGTGEVGEKSLSVKAISRSNLNQSKLPAMRIQRRCAWVFPDTTGLVTIEATARHQEAADDPSSPFWTCGYSYLATGSNKVGNPNGGSHFTSCNYTKEDCLLRLGNPALIWAPGGFAPIEKDTTGRRTGRFSGIQWDNPKGFRSRGFADKAWLDGLNTNNEAKYSDFIPMGWGTFWIDPIILNVVGDANFTRMECLLGTGESGTIRNVIVNDVNVDQYGGAAASIQSGVQLFWKPVTTGDRTGSVNGDTIYDGTGDPFGGLRVISITVPRQLSPSSSLPRVRILMDGAKTRKYINILSATASGGIITVTVNGNNTDVNDGSVVTIEGCGFAAANGTWNALNGTFGSPNGTFQLSGSSATGSGSGGTAYYKYLTANPAWIIMDVLTYGTYRYSDLNLATFISASQYYDGSISFKTVFGTTGAHARFRLGLGIRQRITIADLIKQLRMATRSYLLPDDSGKLQLLVKRTLADEQPAAVTGSNYNTAVKSKNAAGATTNGFVAWKFGYSSVLQKPSGESGLTIEPYSTQNTPNKVTMKYVDEENGYQTDSITQVDAEDVGRVGNEVDGSLSIEGVPNYDQGRRTMASFFAENYRGNNRSTTGDTGGTYRFRIMTSFKCLHLRIGHIVWIDYPQLALNAGLESPSGTGVNGFLARVETVKPSANFETVEITAAYHNDAWYVDTFGQEDAPRQTGLKRDRLTRPALPWLPFCEQPFTNNALWTSTEWGFAVKQTYEQDADGNTIARAIATGKLPVNGFAGNGLRPPSIGAQGTTAATGGTVKAGRSYFLLVCAKDASGSLTPPSDSDIPCQVDVPAGANTATITVPINGWGTGSTGFEIFAGLIRNKMSNQGSGAVTVPSTPASITLTALNDATWGLPDVEFDSITLRRKRMRHAGLVGAEIVSCTSTTITLAVFSTNLFTTNQFAGYYMSVIGLYNNENNVPIVDYLITSNTGSVFTLSAGNPTTVPRGDGTFGLQAKDVVVIRMKSTVGFDGGGNFVEDANWVNALNTYDDQHQVTGASNATPIVITTADAHGFVDGTKVFLQNVGGNANANGVRYAKNLTTNTFALYTTSALVTGIAGSGAYTSGGIVQAQFVGLFPSDEVGSELFIIRGTGAGTSAKINANTATRIYIEGGWTVIPDATSVMVVLNSEWEDSVSTASLDNADPTSTVSVTMQMDNHLGRTFFFQAFTVDGGRNESFRALSPFRELYVFGQPPGVRIVTSNTTVLGTDRLLLVDTTSAAVTIILLPSAAMTGIDLTIKRISAGANNVTILPYGSELIDTASSATLTSQGDSINITGT